MFYIPGVVTKWKGHHLIIFQDWEKKVIRIRSEIHFPNLKAINSHNVFEKNRKNRLLNFYKNSKHQNLIRKLTTFKVMNQIQLQNAKIK
jgi:hypothetical protein